MTWTKLGDEFGDEAADLSDAAHRTHVDALNWSNRLLLDLVIPKRDLRRFAFSPAVAVSTPDSCPVVQELVSSGWWEDRGDTWYVGLRHGIEATMHQLRHRYGTVAYQLSRDLRLVQEQLGHASPVTTAGYSRPSAEAAARMVRAMDALGLPEQTRRAPTPVPAP